MNRHFEDSRYYLTRAFQTTRAGFGEELTPIRARVAALRGSSEDGDVVPGRMERVRQAGRELRARLQRRFQRVRSERAVGRVDG
jgi:hypothetical protein